MQRLFIDTDAVLDLLGEREPFYMPMALLATQADRGKVKFVTSSLTFATAYYVLSKHENAEIAKDKLRKFKVICKICPVSEADVEKGLNSSFADFEDALQYFCALAANCDIIITRNGKDFKNSSIPVMTADEYLKSL